MKGTILLKALEILYNGAVSQVDFFAAVLSAGYGASMSKIDYEYEKLQRRRKAGSSLEDRKRRLRIFISKMKYDGLIKESDNRTFTISPEGRKKLSRLKNGLPGRYYKKTSQTNAVIVSFDIPEKLRQKRDWLREVLKNLGFSMVHQSVWVGNIKIPLDLIVNLEKINILEYLEIFEVTKSGTLKKIADNS